MSEPLNLVGKRFGKLVVIKRVQNTKKGNTQWECKCDCGKTKNALGYDLKNGRTVSCGCNLVGTVAHNRQDLTGQRFGLLTVLKLNKSEKGILTWDCVCDCGKHRIVSSNTLKHTPNISCGCNNRKTKEINGIKVGEKFKDITGQKFNHLTVVELESNLNQKAIWKCQCDCGNFKNVNGKDLKSGHTKSCGCLQKKTKIVRSKNQRIAKNQDRLKQEWYSMKNRCLSTYHGHKGYYDRGITVCQEWIESYSNFKNWALANGYNDNLTLDRINNNKGYSPQNCRWATQKEQANNKTTNVFITYNGKTQTMKQWCDELELSYGTIRARRRNGKEGADLFAPVKKKYNG